MASVDIKAATYSLGALAKLISGAGPNKEKIFKAEETSSCWKTMTLELC